MQGAQLFCANCDAPNRTGRKFCTSCGAALEAGCPTCGAVLDPGGAFCGECGTPVVEAAVSAADPFAETTSVWAERRVVSVLFVDLVAFTTYSEHRDPEDVRDMLALYFEQAENIVGLYGGVVERFIGDGVMAVWGTPVAHEDDTGRAVRAGLDLVEAVLQLGESVGTELHARAGIFTGEAAVNLAAVGQGMMTGDTVNTASRLQSAAAPDTVLVDRATYLGARDTLAFEPAGEVELKGKQVAVETWRPLRVVAGLGGRKFADSMEPAFIGRAEEFRLMKDLLHTTGREGKPRLASIVGVGGIGKSRLVWELFKYVDGLSDSIFWHEGRSPAYGEGVAFWALAEMIRMRAGIAETDDDQAAIAKLDDCISDHFPQGDGDWLRPHLAHLIGLVQDADVGVEQHFAAWRTFFERIAERGPVVLVFEDLHWADAGVIDFIEYLLAWARNSPIFILALARPELLDKRPNWGAGLRNFCSIHMEPLVEDDMMMLLKSVAEDLPAQVRNDISSRSEGVPLYAVEMVRMLIDKGDLAPADAGYRWIGKTADVEIPDTLHSLIASRLDSLATEDRLLVQDASVLGKTFTLDSLSALTSKSSADLEARLNNLVRRDFLVVDTDPRSPERGQYGFVQSLIREVAYQTLSRQNRTDRHLKAAEYFTSLEEPDAIEVIASHYMEAYKNSTKDDAASATLAQRAREALEAAAERAGSLGSSAQALSLLETALSLNPPKVEQARLLFKAGEAAPHVGELEKAAALLEAAIEILRQTDDFDLRARAQAQLAIVYWSTARSDDAARLLAQAVEEVPDKGSIAAATLYEEYARISTFLGNHEVSSRYTALAMQIAERADDVALIADCLSTRAIGAIWAGRTREADALLRGALHLSEKHGLPSQQARALVNVSANDLAVDPRAAVENARKGLEVADRLGSHDQRSYLLDNLIDASVHLARWDEIRLVMSEEADSLGENQFYLFSSAAVAEAYAGNLDLAEGYLAKLKTFIQDTSSMQDSSSLALAEATVAFVRGDYRSALAEAEGMEEKGFAESFSTHLIVGRAALWGGLLEEAKEQLEVLERSPLRNPWQRCRRITLEAGIAALDGDRDAAIELYRRALRSWEELDIPLGKALCQMDFALLVGGVEAQDARAAAEAFFEASGNKFFVRKLQEAAS
ncbi:MAG: AAA family ATPase [Actinomycetota bacterium]|nr:AAA family ATPase [Actinomycetota bacterium]